MDCPYCAPDRCEVGAGLCHCGCGSSTSPHATDTKGVPIGTPQKWLPGHWNHQHRSNDASHYETLRQRLDDFVEHNLCPWDGPECRVGAGLCHCGCGQPTNRAPHNDANLGLLTGMPRKFVFGHANRKPTITEQVVRQLRHEYATTKVSQSELGRRYGIAQSSISKILRFESYSDVGIATDTDTQE